MPNLTPSVDEKLLDRAKATARREQVSLNTLVRDVLASHVDGKGDERLTLDDWFAMADRSPTTQKPRLDGGRGWTRAKLYPRQRT